MSQKPKYNESDMQSALLDVRMGMSVYTAAKRWRIPKTNPPLPHPRLHQPRRRQRRPPEDQQGPGGPPGALGFPVSQGELWDFARRVLEKSGAGGPPGKQWVYCFLKRYPEITKVNEISYETSNAPRPTKTGLEAQQQLSPVAEQSAVGQQAAVTQQTPVGQQSPVEQQSPSETERAVEQQVFLLQDALTEDREDQRGTPNKETQQPSVPVTPVARQEPCFVLIDSPTS